MEEVCLWRRCVCGGDVSVEEGVSVEEVCLWRYVCGEGVSARHASSTDTSPQTQIHRHNSSTDSVWGEILSWVDHLEGVGSV